MVERWGISNIDGNMVLQPECGYWVSITAYKSLEAELARQKELLINLAHRLEDENQRMINLAGDALGFSQYQRDSDTVEVLANYCKRLGEELAECKAEIVDRRNAEENLKQSWIDLDDETKAIRARCERLEGALKRVLMWNPKSTEAACQQDYAFAKQALEVPRE